MSDDKIYNDTITIESVEQKNEKITLVAHNRNRYGFWTKKKDGTDSAPYAQFQTMGLKKGSTVLIGYVIEIYTDKLGVTRESKKIINFRETNDFPSQVPPSLESSNGEANRGLPGRSNDAFGRRLAIHGFVNGVLAAGATIETIVGDLPALVVLEDEIDKALSAPIGANLDEGLPVIQQGNDLSGEGVPF